MSVAIAGSDIRIARGMPARKSLEACLDAGLAFICGKPVGLAPSTAYEFWIQTGAESVGLLIRVTSTGNGVMGIYRDSVRSGGIAISWNPMNDVLGGSYDGTAHIGGSVSAAGRLFAEKVIAGLEGVPTVSRGFYLQAEPNTVYRVTTYNLDTVVPQTFCANFIALKERDL